MTEKLKLSWIYGLSAIFLIANSFALYFGFYWLMLLPVILLILYYSIYSLDKILLLVVFSTPLAINFQKLDFGLGLSVPTEPLLGGVLVLFLMKIFLERGFDRKIMNHPVTLSILFSLIWIFITSLTSSMPLVSFKFLIARLWFVIPFYFLGTQLFKKYNNINTFHWLYIIPLTVVIIWTLYNHAIRGFEEEPAHWVMSPFFNDHTAYGAILAMFFPVLISFLFSRNYNLFGRVATIVFISIFVIAIIFSYTRAAWLSLAAALGVYLIFLFRIKLKVFLLGLSASLAIFFLIQDQLFMKLEKNKQDSSDDIAKHVQSISNIKSDASNMERINRWNSALRMFDEKPLLGWGPGTYMFKYAPFQMAKDKTIISTNAGDRGNAHSEYIGPLAEQGVLGCVSIIAILITVSATASRLIYRAKDRNIRIMAIGIFLGLVTYFIHGALNNFLDTDKASVPFWAFIGMLVALETYHAGDLSKSSKTLPDKDAQ